MVPIALVLAGWLATGCSFTKDIQAHRERLLAATAPDVSASAKRDALGESAVAMMHQALDRLNPKRGAQYVRAYAKTNGPLIDTLAAQIGRAQAGMTDAQRVGFALSAAREPYAREALELVPRFVRKYEQISAVTDISRRLKEAVLGKLGEGLGQRPASRKLPGLTASTAQP